MGNARKSLVVSDLAGVVVDDKDATLTGDWKSGAVIGPFVADGYRHDGNDQKGKLTARFRAKLPQAGKYEVRAAYSANDNRATNVPVTIRHAKGEAKVKVDQRKEPPADGPWAVLGTFEFAADEPAEVIIATEGTDGHVIVDAIQFLPIK